MRVSPFVNKMKMMMRFFNKTRITVSFAKKAKGAVCAHLLEI